MKFSIAILLATIVNLIYCPLASLAENIVEQYSTADLAIATSPKDFAGQITLLEIGFKESENDYVIFQVDAPEQKINLKGLQFHDDRDFKVISRDFWVESGSRIKLTFNSSSPDMPSTGELFSDKKGLTSTTEQILIHIDHEPLAFFCWVREPIAKGEITEFVKIYPEQKWDEAEIENCFPSETVKNNQILERVGNENNSGSWRIKAEQNPSPPETATPKSKATTNTELNSIIDSANGNRSETEGVLLLTEIFPAPKNKEQFEWIEVLNTGHTDINLDGWIIDDSEGGSKPKRLSGIVARPNVPLIINLKTYKINLNNDQDTVRLFEPDGTPVIEQDYDSVQKGASYSLITVNEEERWEWTANPSPSEINPNLTTVTGEVITPAQFTDQYFFALEDENQVKYLITFSEDVIKAPLARGLFKEGITGSFTGQLNEAPPNDNDYIYSLNLSDYELDTTGVTPLNWPLLLIIVTIPLLTVGSYLLVKKQKIWTPLMSDNS